MASKIYWLHEFAGAKLGIMARPRGGDWLEDEIANLKKQNVGLLVSLLEASEVYELELQNEEEICKEHNIEFINFSIRDRSIPTDKVKTNLLVQLLENRIEKKQAIVIHCRMGIGRSSIIAGCVLLKTGQKAIDILNHISKVRGLKVPDTDEQIKWLKNHE